MTKHHSRTRKWTNKLPKGIAFGVWEVVRPVPDPRPHVVRKSTAWYLFRCVCGATKVARKTDAMSFGLSCQHDGSPYKPVGMPTLRKPLPHIDAIRMAVSFGATADAIYAQYGLTRRALATILSPITSRKKLSVMNRKLQQRIPGQELDDYEQETQAQAGDARVRQPL